MDNYNYIVRPVVDLCDGQEQQACNPPVLSFDNNITVNLSFSLLRTLVRPFISVQVVVLTFSCRRVKLALCRCMFLVVYLVMLQTPTILSMQRVIVTPAMMT